MRGYSEDQLGLAAFAGALAASGLMNWLVTGSDLGGLLCIIVGLLIFAFILARPSYLG